MMWQIYNRSICGSRDASVVVHPVTGKQEGVIDMDRFYLFKNAAAIAAIFVSALFPLTPSSATPSAPGTASALVSGSAILMGVAVAAPMQSDMQQSADREALRKQLKYLMDNNVRSYSQYRFDERPRIVRVVFDVGPDGSATNVRIGKHSGNNSIDRYGSSLVSSFKNLPGGERHRVCTLLQYVPLGQDPSEAAYMKSMKEETDSAIADIRAGRDGPKYDRRGHIIA